MIQPVYAEDATPLRLHAQTALQFFRTMPIPSSGFTSKDHYVEVWSSRTFVNHWIQSPDISVDAETKNDLVGAQIQLSPTLDLRLASEYLSLTVSRMDQFTVDFHNLFGLSQAEREESENNVTSIDIPRAGASIGEDSEFQTIYSRQRFRLRKKLFSDSKLTSSLGVEAVHEKNYLLDPDRYSYDMSYDFYLDYQLGAASLRINSAYIVPAIYKRRALNMATGFSHTIGLDWRAATYYSLHFQSFITEPLFHDMDQFGLAAYEWVFGQKIKMGYLSLEFGVLENAFYHRNTPDWGLYFGGELLL